MEEIRVSEVVRMNKKNTKVFGPFMSERIVCPDGRPGQLLSQFLAEERLQGRYPLLGDGPLYRPIEEGTIVVTPRKWGATTPDELVGALVGVTVIGTIPVAEDDPDAGEILIVRLTEPDGTAPADFVRAGLITGILRAGLTSGVETEINLGWDTWVDYPPGIPTAFPEEEPEPAPDSDDTDDEGYW